MVEIDISNAIRYQILPSQLRKKIIAESASLRFEQEKAAQDTARRIGWYFVQGLNFKKDPTNLNIVWQRLEKKFHEECSKQRDVRIASYLLTNYAERIEEP